MATGTCYKRIGTDAYFYSRNGAWKHPIAIRGLDPTDVVPGYKYQISNDFKTIERRMERNQYFDKDVREHGLDVGDSGTQPAMRSQAGREYLPPQSVYAGATGFAKSCLEQGMKPHEAAEWGLRWASLWADIPEKAKVFLQTEVKDGPPTPPSGGGSYDVWLGGHDDDRPPF